MPTSPPLRWADLAGRRVGVWGLGAEGRASRRRLEALGVEPVLVDDRPPEPRVLATADGGLEALAECEVVIKTPGISRYRADVRRLEDSGVAVVGGLGLWLEEVGPENVVCVTGTKGKSTTVALLGHLLSGAAVRCFLGGNFGRPPFATDVPDDVDLWVIEASSYQTTDLWSSPAVVAVTSLHPDHLDWHGGVEQYYRDKLSLCGRPGARVTIANGADSELRARAHLLRPGPQWVVPTHGPAEAWLEALPLRGEHNRMNALIARACLEAVGVEEAADPMAMARLAAGFESLPSRLRTVAVVEGVEFVDDSLSTNVLPTVAALSVFAGRRVALLVGGFERNIDYAPLADSVAARRSPTLVVSLPDNGWRIREAVEEVAPPAMVDTLEGENLAAAAEKAFLWAGPGGVVLLSPAAPSFGAYRDYRDRAADFSAIVASLGGRHAVRPPE